MWLNVELFKAAQLSPRLDGQQNPDLRIRQERKLKSVHPNWKARAKLKDEIVELAHLLEHFAAEL